MNFDSIETVKVFSSNEDMNNAIDCKNIEKPIAVVYSSIEDKGCYVNMYKAYFIISGDDFEGSEIGSEQRVYSK